MRRSYFPAIGAERVSVASTIKACIGGEKSKKRRQCRTRECSLAWNRTSVAALMEQKFSVPNGIFPCSRWSRDVRCIAPSTIAPKSRGRVVFWAVRRETHWLNFEPTCGPTRESCMNSQIFFCSTSDSYWSEREDLNLRPLVSQSCTLDQSFFHITNWLADFSCRTSGLSSGLLYAIQRGCHLFIQYMGVFRGGLDVGVIHRLLHQLQVASLSQELGPVVVPVVVKSEVGNLRLSPEALPCRFETTIGDRIALAFD